MWLNDLFWGIRAHFLGETVTFGDERSLWRALSTLWTNPPKKSLQGAEPPPLSGNARILGTFEPPSPPLYSDTKILIQTPTGLQGEHMLRSSSQTQMYVGKISQIASTATKETGV